MSVNGWLGPSNASVERSSGPERTVTDQPDPDFVAYPLLGFRVRGAWVDEAQLLPELTPPVEPRLVVVSTMAGSPAGGGWHYPTETFYEDQSHIIRGEN